MYGHGSVACPQADRSSALRWLFAALHAFVRVCVAFAKEKFELKKFAQERGVMLM